MKKTKIVCTMGPNTNDREMMRKLIQNGMNVARFNFSHGDHEEQKFRMDMLKELREEEHATTAILLDTKGKEMSSEDFSHWMEKKMVTGSSHFCFLIGGPYGNSDLLRKRAQLRFCLGQITLTHQMARLILTEQIYRAMKIMRHEPYHL